LVTLVVVVLLVALFLSSSLCQCFQYYYQYYNKYSCANEDHRRRSHSARTFSVCRHCHGPILSSSLWRHFDCSQCRLDGSALSKVSTVQQYATKDWNQSSQVYRHYIRLYLYMLIFSFCSWMIMIYLSILFYCNVNLVLFSRMSLPDETTNKIRPKERL
jgi:hypothetical protein